MVAAGNGDGSRSHLRCAVRDSWRIFEAELDVRLGAPSDGAAVAGEVAGNGNGGFAAVVPCTVHIAGTVRGCRYGRSNRWTSIHRRRAGRLGMLRGRTADHYGR